MKCKNIECESETIGKRVYCSLSCRNIYVNKYLRNYDKVSNTVKNKEKLKEEKYLESPNLCLFCNEIIPYKIRENKFCNHSCSAKITNSNREYTWGDKISKSLDVYFELNPKIKTKRIGKKRLYELKCKCGEIFYKNRSEVKYCSTVCLKKYRINRNVDEYKAYKSDTKFKFNLSDYPKEFDFSLIKKYGWYSPTNKNNNLKGVSRDHMLSVREGFEIGIDPKLISHPANCKLMIHNENISKNKRSSITYEELLERIKIFEEKYKN
jgi:hypothetical protein